MTFEYSCVFVPYEGSYFVFLFETDTSPEAKDFGFSDCIQNLRYNGINWVDKLLDISEVVEECYDRN